MDGPIWRRRYETLRPMRRYPEVHSSSFGAEQEEKVRWILLKGGDGSERRRFRVSLMVRLMEEYVSCCTHLKESSCPHVYHVCDICLPRCILCAQT